VRNRRYIILVLLFICSVYLFESYFLAPSSENYREAIAKEYKTLQRYEYVVREAGSTEGEIKAVITDMKNTEKRLIAEKSVFLASARLQREITDLTGKAGLNLATIRPMNAGKQNNYNVVQAYFEGNGNIKQVSEFLKLLESGPLLLKIDKLSINITNMQQPDDLKFKMQISGLSKI
jgi:predicted RND superfamily exporter protein